MLFFMCIDVYGKVVVDGAPSEFQMIINKPKPPFCNITFRNESGSTVMNEASILPSMTIQDVFAFLYINTNAQALYTIGISCTPFVSEPGNSYMGYTLRLYQKDSTPYPGGELQVVPKADGTYASEYATASDLITFDKYGNQEETEELAKIAIQMLDAEKAVAGMYKATIKVMVANV